MALKRKDDFRYFENVSEASVSPLENEALIVKRILVDGAPTNTFAHVLVGKTTVGYHPVDVEGIPTLAFPKRDTPYINLLDYLNEKDIELTYPVASGETFLVKFGGTVSRVKIIYDVYDGGDVKPEDPNGSKSDVLTFINPVTHSVNVTASGYVRLDKSLAPAELPDFPAEPVPSGQKITVYSIMALPLATSVGDGTASLGTSYSKFLRIFYRRQVLFDPDRNGFLVLGNEAFSTTGTTKLYDYSEIANDLPIPNQHNAEAKIFDPPLEFIAGEEVNLEAYFTVDPDVPIDAEKFRAFIVYKIEPLR